MCNLSVGGLPLTEMQFCLLISSSAKSGKKLQYRTALNNGTTVHELRHDCSTEYYCTRLNRLFATFAKSGPMFVFFQFFLRNFVISTVAKNL